MDLAAPLSPGPAARAGAARLRPVREGAMVSPSIMTTVTTCSNLAEAQLLKALLDDAGIPAFLPEELTANSAPQLVFGSGLRVQVEDEDAEEARQVLADAELPPEGSGADHLR